MTYLSGKANKRKQNIRRLALVVFFIVIVIFWTTVKKGLYPVIEPLLIGYGHSKGIASNIPEFFYSYTTSKETIIEKNKILEHAIENLENELAEKNAQLKEFNFIINEGESVGDVIVMYPLMTDITKLYSTILLSKGFKDGVEKDGYVYIRGRQPVCIIKEVYTSTSLCELISASGIKTDVIIEGNSSSTMSLTLTGRGGGVFLGDVVRDTSVAIGDRVYLSSDPGMIIGTVVDVMHNNQDTSWRVFVSGAYNPVTSSVFYLHKK